MDDDAGGVRFADVPLADQLSDAHADREKPQLVVDHGHGANPLRDALHVSGFGQVSGHRFFAEDMLPRFERGNYHAVMEVRRGGDDDGVDVAVADELAKVGEMCRDAVVEGGGPRPLGATGANCHRLEVRVLTQGRQVQRRAEAGANDADANRLLGSRPRTWLRTMIGSSSQ